jgi:hypothetical protein
MKYVVAIFLLAACSGDADLSYRVESEHVVVEGKSKVDAGHAKAAAAVNQVIIDSLDK